MGYGVLGGEAGAVGLRVAGVAEDEEGEVGRWVVGSLGRWEGEGVGAGFGGPALDDGVVCRLLEPGVDSEGHGKLSIIIDQLSMINEGRLQAL